LRFPGKSEKITVKKGGFPAFKWQKKKDDLYKVWTFKTGGPNITIGIHESINPNTIRALLSSSSVMSKI
jgi:hypothetical protein